MSNFLRLDIVRFYVDFECICHAGISILMYVLFAINSLPFVYLFSFLNRDPSGLVRLLTYIPLGLSK